MGQQGSWNRWNLTERKLTWQELWLYEPVQVSFFLRSVYDLLPTPTKLVFPDVVQTSLRPDIVIWSTVPKVMILVELTVPWEERTDEANERKRSKYMYQELADLCREKGFSTWVFPVEVGCRGFPAQSVWKALGALGMKGMTRKSSVQALSRTAERASSWLWLRRNKATWKPAQTSSA